MVDFTFKANNTLFEDKYVQWSEVNIPAPGSDLLNQGSLYSWGQNDIGQLGLSDRTHRSSPVQVGSFNNWAFMKGGYLNSFGITSAGALYSWGSNTNGELGLNDTTHRSSPVQVGSMTNWKSLNLSSSQTQFVHAIKTDGTLWAWGRNQSGSLGLGDLTHRSSPVQVGALTNWKQVASTFTSTVAVKTDGTLWAWGNNSQGELGLNNKTTYSSPVQVGLLTNWNKVSMGNYHVLAIKTDGTLWAWGRNDFAGPLGLGDTTSISSPVQVGLLNNWIEVSTGAFSSLAIKTDGTLWSWGYNDQGSLGLGDLTNRSSPVQVGALTNWKYVAACDESSQDRPFSLATKTDGTLWAWGRNQFFGQLGLSDRTNRSSPVQVGSLTNWSIVFPNGGNVLALTKRYGY